MATINNKGGRPPVEDPKIGVKITILRSSLHAMEEIARRQPGIPKSYFYQIAINEFIARCKRSEGMVKL